MKRENHQQGFTTGPTSAGSCSKMLKHDGQASGDLQLSSPGSWMNLGGPFPWLKSEGMAKHPSISNFGKRNKKQGRDQSEICEWILHPDW